MEKLYTESLQKPVFFQEKATGAIYELRETLNEYFAIVRDFRGVNVLRKLADFQEAPASEEAHNRAVQLAALPNERAADPLAALLASLPMRGSEGQR